MNRIMRDEKDPVPQSTGGEVRYISSSEFDDVGAMIVTTTPDGKPLGAEEVAPAAAGLLETPLG